MKGRWAERPDELLIDHVKLAPQNGWGVGWRFAQCFEVMNAYLPTLTEMAFVKYKKGGFRVASRLNTSGDTPQP